MRVALLALPGSMRSALAGLTDMFWLANQVIGQNHHATARFETQIVTAEAQPCRMRRGE